jgi:dihydroxyacetone kinase-like protein
MGTLMASGLMNAGKAFRGVECIEDSLWPTFFEAYFEGVQNRGKARLGDKTFLDGLYPAIEALKVHGDDLRAASSLAAKAADDAFHATRGDAGPAGAHGHSAGSSPASIWIPARR